METLLNPARKPQRAPTVEDIDGFISAVRRNGLSSLEQVDSFRGIKKWAEFDISYIEEMNQRFADFCFISDNSDFYHHLLGQTFALTNDIRRDIPMGKFAICIGFVLMISFFADFITKNIANKRRRQKKVSDSFFYPGRVYCVCRSNVTDHDGFIINV